MNNIKLHPFDNICDPLEIPFITFLFNFGPINRLIDVPYDPHLKYINEQHGIEFMMSVRLLTHGYKLFAPSNDIVFHNYNLDQNINKKRDEIIHTPKYIQRHGHIKHETTINAATAVSVKKATNETKGENADANFDIFISQGIQKDLRRMQHLLKLTKMLPAIMMMQIIWMRLKNMVWEII